MARKKKTAIIEDLPEAAATPQLITDTIEKNYMPYVMSVIISRAIPDIDGFKPAHRKLLYTMYKMGLLTGHRTKSANVVGQTMRLNPHGDMAIYETMVRLTRGNESLLHPFVDSKGSFGKQYSRDMAFAASRYTEVKLDAFCNELFSGIDKNAVDFVPNYDNTMTEPSLLPTTFPNILVSSNIGIAVGMACSICSFNLSEICDGTIALLKNPKTSLEKIMDLIKAPDFPGGALLVYEKEKIRELYESGVGSVKLRAKYVYDKENNSIDIVQIPYSTSIEAIMKKITELVKGGKLREIVDIRDAIDLSGFKLTIDLRRGTDPDKLMAKLYKLTPLESNFDGNFNILIDGSPRQMGIIEILSEWIRFRMTCYKRELNFDLEKKKDKLHLLLGLAAILLDIDKAIKIIRSTEKECDVVPNLMDAFSIDQIQSEYIAEIKLRHLNREYILNRVTEIEGLQKEIEELEELLADDLKIKAKISEQLTNIKKKYGMTRKTEIVEPQESIDFEEPEVENYNIRVVMTRDGYFKKITAQSLRGNDEQKLKEGDRIVYSEDCDNRAEFLIFTDKAQVYKAKACDFDQQKASALGDYLPAKLSMDEDEHPIMMKAIYEYNPKHNIILIFANGKGVRVSVENYFTKTNRRKLSPAFSSASPVVAAFYENDPVDVLIINNVGRAILVDSKIIPIKATRTSAGTTLFTLKAGKQYVVSADIDIGNRTDDVERYRKRKIPATGILLSEKDIEFQQIKFE